MDNSFNTTSLEFDIVIEEVLTHTVSQEGKEEMTSLTPFNKKDLLKKELDRVTEMVALLRYDDPFPLQGYGDLSPHIEKATFEGGFMNPPGLFMLLGFLRIVEKVKKYINQRRDKYPLLKKITNTFNYLTSLQQEIGKILDSQGNIKPRASQKLYTLQKTIESTQTKVRRKLEATLKALISQGYARDENLVIRQGRLALPLKEENRSRVKGIVIDQSASGATLFMEPLEVIELNNQIHRLESEKNREIERILKEITRKVRDNISDIQTNIKTFGFLDTIYAKAQFSLQLDCIPAEINRKGKLKLIKGRHPLLLLRNSKDEVVPLSLAMDQNIRTVVITGPNAGGKTVALKTVGLLSLMHNFGFHIPAEEGSSFPFFSGIFAAIGDHQSIQHDLSTFSSHIETLNGILKKSDASSLVLVDEIGSSTDPTEGAALAEVILEYVTDLGCLTLATTHMGALKVFASQHQYIENGSMLFDSEKLSPSYRFQMGLPGSSYAFEIAQKYGMNKNILSKARKRVGEERGRLDTLIVQLEKEIQRSSRLSKEAEIKHLKLEGLVNLYQERLDEITTQGQEKKKKIVEEAESFLKNANVEIENIIKEIKEKQAEKSAIKAAKETLAQQKEKIKQLQRNKELAKKEPLGKGDFVFWHGHTGKGTIISESDSTGRVLVDWDGVRLKVPRQELELSPVSDQKQQEVPEANLLSVNDVSDTIRDEIDLRGMRAEDAVFTVDKYLSDAAMAGFQIVRIIHGKGTGILREVIGRHLRDHSLVKDFRLGRWNEGDTGVTIVEIK